MARAIEISQALNLIAPDCYVDFSTETCKLSYIQIAEILSEMLCRDELAELMNQLLSCEDDYRLTDEQSEIGMTLFDALCDVVSPEVIELAQNG